MIADLTRGTGRYNVTFGVVATMPGIGASLSTTVAGVIIVTGGYDRAFLVLAGIAFLALLIFLFAMPEPVRSTGRAGGHRPGVALASRRRAARLSPSPPVRRRDPPDLTVAAARRSAARRWR
ncbi:MAG: hypothetical protein WCC65_15745, partial [Pseudonocardiaceae bacterium]